MKYLLLTAVLISFTVSNFNSKRVEALIQKEVKAAFQIENYTAQVVTIPSEMNSALPVPITESNFFSIHTEDEKLGYYFLGQGFGKTDYFDFIVIFNTQLNITKIKVLVYREDHGGEIGSKRWLKQFDGTSVQKELTYNKDIAGISGATLSAKSITLEVNKILKTMEILHHKSLI
jgi:Na+-translocating ferredoxin:NAD+ oxidoreductase RnfG subunit